MELAIVTGANKGIGFEIVKQLLQGSSSLHIILACRNITLGQQALQTLQSQGFINPSHHQVEVRELDISNSISIQSFIHGINRDFHQSLDILINNAAIAFKDSDPTPFREQARPTLMTNYFGTYELIIGLLPALRNAKRFGRLVNVASEAGHLRIVKTPSLKQTFANIPELTIPHLNELLMKFIQDVENGTHVENGWPSTCYGTSKLAVVALTKRLALEETTRYEESRKGGDGNLKQVSITCCCPGYCDTDMTSHKGTKTASQGAETPTWLALQSEYNPETNGKFFAEKREIVW